MTGPTTTANDPVRLHVGRLMAWTGGVLVVLAVVGYFPSTARAGSMGLVAQGIAALAVLLGIAVSGLLVMLAAGRGPAAAALTFIGTGVVRPLLCAVLVGVVFWYYGQVPVQLLVAHVAVFYVAGLFCETLWLYRALQRHSRDAALASFGMQSKMDAIREGRV